MEVAPDRAVRLVVVCVWFLRTQQRAESQCQVFGLLLPCGGGGSLGDQD